MGPGDPFSQSSSSPTQTPPASPLPPTRGLEQSASPRAQAPSTISWTPEGRQTDLDDIPWPVGLTTAICIGMSAGFGLGLVSVFGTFSQVLIVLSCVVAGGLVAGLIFGVRAGLLNFAGAWRALWSR